MLTRLRDSLTGSTVMDMDGYRYFIHPVTDGIPEMDPLLLDEIAGEIVRVADMGCDIIVCPEAMGIPLAVTVSMRLGIPYSIIRRRRYGISGEVDISQHTGYSEKEMYINGIRRGDRVVVMDDVLSTGGTMSAIIRALKDTIGAVVVDAVTVFEKDPEAKERLFRDCGIRVKTLMKVRIDRGRLVCAD